MVERGPGPRTLDTALLQQAHMLGVEVRFSSRLDCLEGPGILAADPKAADAIAVGYHFETAMEDGFWGFSTINLRRRVTCLLVCSITHGTTRTFSVALNHWAMLGNAINAINALGQKSGSSKKAASVNV